MPVQRPFEGLSLSPRRRRTAPLATLLATGPRREVEPYSSGIGIGSGGGPAKRDPHVNANEADTETPSPFAVATCFCTLQNTPPSWRGRRARPGGHQADTPTRPAIPPPRRRTKPSPPDSMPSSGRPVARREPPGPPVAKDRARAAGPSRGCWHHRRTPTRRSSETSRWPGHARSSLGASPTYRCAPRPHFAGDRCRLAGSRAGNPSPA